MLDQVVICFDYFWKFGTSIILCLFSTNSSIAVGMGLGPVNSELRWMYMYLTTKSAMFRFVRHMKLVKSG